MHRIHSLSSAAVDRSTADEAISEGIRGGHAAPVLTRRRRRQRAIGGDASLECRVCFACAFFLRAAAVPARTERRLGLSAARLRAIRRMLTIVLETRL